MQATPQQGALIAVMSMRRTLAVMAISFSGLLAAPIAFGDSFEALANADLAVEKSDFAFDPVLYGDEIRYTLEVTNNGPLNAANVKVTDALPDGVTFVAAGSDASCAEAGGIVTCAFGVVGAGADETKTLVVDTSGAQSLTVTNTATVSSAANDPVPGNDSDTELTGLLPVADLAIEKSDFGSDPVTVGEQIRYSLTVSNSGPVNAAGVVASDTLPAGLTFEPGDSDGACAEAAGTVSCDFGVVGVGDELTKTVVATTSESAAPAVSNTATVAGEDPDPNLSDNADSETTTVNPIPAADLSVTKTDSADPILVGGQTTYTLAVLNDGPGTATGVEVSDVLPTGLSFVAAGSDPACSAVGTVVTCVFGALADGAGASKQFVVAASPAAAPGVLNIATVSGDQLDPAPATNSDTETTTVNAVADLSISKADLTDPMNAGEDLAYVLSVHNQGPSPAQSVSATDVLPPGLTFKPAGSSPGCGVAGGVVTCGFGTVASGATSSRTVTVTTSGTNVPAITNSASVDGADFDPNLANNTEAETTAVHPAANLILSKSDTPDPAAPGDVIAYTLSVRNNGPNAASNVDVVDVLPGGLSFRPIGSSIACVQNPPGTITCHYGAVASGATESHVVLVLTSAPGTIANTASVDGDQFDPALANNLDTETTIATGPPVPAPTLGTATLTPRAGKCATPKAKRKRKCGAKRKRKRVRKR